jgi:predicted enzyme related to lactoylglutathione lyase
MTDITDRTPTVDDEQADPPRPFTFAHGDVAYASRWVHDVDRAARFFSEVLGWTYVAAPADRRHLAGTTLSHGIFATTGSPTLFLCLAVADIGAATEAIRAGGGQAGPADQSPNGLVAECVDPLGTAFAIVEVPEDPTGAPRQPANGARHGDLAYITMMVTDSAAARAFYGAVFGWQFTPGSIDDGWQVEGPLPMTGLAGRAAEALVEPMYRVDDIAAAAQRVRTQGGTATDPDQRPYGLLLECTDDQGTRFYLGQL